MVAGSARRVESVMGYSRNDLAGTERVVDARGAGYGGGQREAWHDADGDDDDERDARRSNTACACRAAATSERLELASE